MKLYLVRHAQRGWGKDYDRLNKTGREQARRMAHYFKDKKITVVYCSENKRAIQTLDYIKPFVRKARIIISRDVRQHNVPEEVGKGVIKEFDLKIETEGQLQKRVVKFFNWLKKDNKRDNVLIISHKEVIKALICYVMKRPFKEEAYINKLPSASISHFEFNSENKLKDALIGDLTPLLEK